MSRTKLENYHVAFNDAKGNTQHRFFRIKSSLKGFVKSNYHSITGIWKIESRPGSNSKSITTTLNKRLVQ